MLVKIRDDGKVEPITAQVHKKSVYAMDDPSCPG